jgi:hypothetical protein
MKKKKIKIGFKYFEEGFNPENNFFTNLLRKEYEVVISENPDYLFYCVYPEVSQTKEFSNKGEVIRRISPKLYVFLRKAYILLQKALGRRKRPVPEGDFVKIFFGGEFVKPNMDECDWAFSCYFEEDINHPKYMRIPVFMICDYPLKRLGAPPLKKEIDFKKIKKEKKKFCNFIYSQDIPERNNFFKQLSKYKEIDAPGRCMNNMPPIGSHSDAKKSRLARTWVEDKLDFIKKYKFTIAFENISRPGWTTEKLTHPMLVNSIPIYIGHPSVVKEFNPNSFINFNNFKNMKEFIEYIIKVDKDDKLYERMLREPWYKDNKLPRDFDIKRIQKRFKEIFG